MNYWLFKSEPDAFSISDLAKLPGQQSIWDGVRNYQARNLMRDQMHIGDFGFFYHSSCATPGIVGRVEIIKQAQPDPTQFDSSSPYYDAKSSEQAPRWYAVTLRLEQIFDSPLSLKEMKQMDELLNSEFSLLKKGNRLSVMPVSTYQWRIIHQKIGVSPC